MTAPPKKLIEVARPLPEIDGASAYDNTPGIGPRPKGIHHWWARLVLPATRPVLFASVVDAPLAHPDRFTTEAAQAAEPERPSVEIPARMPDGAPKTYSASSPRTPGH